MSETAANWPQRPAELGPEAPGTLMLLHRIVPLEIARQAEMDPQGRIDAARTAWREVLDCQRVDKGPPTSGGAALQFGGPSYKRELIALAVALGALAHQPGGVSVFGRHWCTDHAACEGAQAYAERINACPEHGPDRPPARTVETVPLAGVS